MKQSWTQDHYAALGVPQNASDREIRAAFRRMAKRSHPDKNRGNPNARFGEFEEIVRAYRTLSDEARRREYDRQSAAASAARRGPVTPRSLCCDLFALLLAERGEEALQTLKRLARCVNAPIYALNMDQYLHYEDARDCEFLAGEALEAGGFRTEAIAFYERSLLREKARPHFRIFTREIQSRLRRLKREEAAASDGADGERKAGMEPRQTTN